MLRDSECTLGQMPHAMAELAQNSGAAECKRMGAPAYCSWSWYWTIDLETSNPHHGRPASTFWPGNPLRSPSGFSEFWAIYHCCPPYMIWFSFKQLSGSNAQKYLTSTCLQKAGWEEKENADLCIPIKSIAEAIIICSCWLSNCLGYWELVSALQTWKPFLFW